jgi:hypothetical protein
MHIEFGKMEEDLITSEDLYDGISRNNKSNHGRKMKRKFTVTFSGMKKVKRGPTKEKKKNMTILINMKG